MISPQGVERDEAGAGCLRADRGGDPGEGQAAHEGLRQGGGGQHGGVHAALQTDERRPHQGRPAAQGFHSGEY